MAHRVLFIGGCHDGEIEEFDRLHATWEVVQMVPLPVANVIERGFNPGEIISTRSTTYRLEHLVGDYGERYWFYVVESMRPGEWLEKLIMGYQSPEVNKDV